MAKELDATPPQTAAIVDVPDLARVTKSQLSALLYELAALLSTDGKPQSAALVCEAARRFATGAA